MFEKWCAINASPGSSFIDHITPLASILNIPLIISSEKNANLVSRYYPEVSAHYWPDFAFRCKEWVERCDTWVSCDYWMAQQTWALQWHTHKTMRFIFCPHGQSDKGYQSNCLEPYAFQETVLLYGSLMQKMLTDLHLFDSIRKTIFVGNFRRSYYRMHRDRLLAVARKEIFSKLNSTNRTLLYAPTWKDAEQSGTLFEFGDRLLKELPSDWNLIIKLHPDVEQREPVLFYRLSLIEEKRPNFLVLTDFPLVYPILEMVDAYLGDYSSVGYDFLSFQKPMFFLKKPHLVQATLHECGQVLDPCRPLFQSIEQGIVHDPLFHERRNQLYQQAFASVEDVHTILQQEMGR